MMGLVHQPAVSQEFAREISQYVGSNARPFLQPVVDALQSNIHAGLFHPTFPSDGFHVSVQFVGMAVGIPDNLKTFRSEPFSRPVEFTQNGIVFLGDLELGASTLPTAAGLSRTVTFTGRLKRIRPKGLPYTPGLYDFIQRDGTVTIGGGNDLSTIVVGIPQVAIGSLYNTDLIVRYIPPITLPDLGEVRAFGVGLRHMFSQYVSLPVDMSVQLIYQSLGLAAQDREYKIDSDLSAFTLQVMLSKTISAGLVRVSPYIAAGYEQATLQVNYVFADPYIGKQAVEFDSGGRARLTAGVGITLWKVNLHADYNLALLNGVSFGIGIAF